MNNKMARKSKSKGKFDMGVRYDEYSINEAAWFIFSEIN
jgi:hypothetical protein